jgi:ABC-type sugar transport system permease subunit
MKGRTVFRAIFFIPVILSTGIIAKSDAANNIQAVYSAIDIGEVSSSVEEVSNAFGVDSLMYYMEQVFSFSPWILNFVEAAAENVYGIINNAGVQILIFLSGLQSISPSLYEAAAMEGCSKWESFWKITLPMISPMILVNIIYTIVDSFTKYDNNVMRIIQEQLLGADYGNAAAGAWVYFLIIAFLVTTILGVASRFVFYQNRE